MLKHFAQQKQVTSHRWFRRGFGRWVAREEKRLCRETIADVLGLYGVQLGGDSRLLDASPVRHKLIIAANAGDIHADWRALPLETDSLDLIVFVHTLETTDTPHDVLREAVRALRPEGRLVIIGFNPWSLLTLSYKTPWRRRWLSVARINDWLALLEMQPLGGSYAVFLPPWRAMLSRRWRMRWLELAGRRWWPLAGGIYVLHTVKRRHAMRLIMSTQFNKKNAKKTVAGTV